MKQMSGLMDLSHRQLILFDLDGTLVDSAPDLSLAMNSALLSLGRDLVTEQQIRQWVGQGAGQLCHCVIAFQEREPSDAAVQQLLAAFMQVYQRNLCVKSQIYPEVVDFLNYCLSAGKRLACVTNKPYPAAHALLQQLALLDYFDLLLGGDSLPQHKPHPAQLQYCLQYFQTQAAHCLMIGDSRNDVEAARAAGIDCIVLSYGYNHGEPLSACQPQLIIDGLSQLIPN